MTVDPAKILQSKNAFRQHLAALAIEEKLSMLDGLRERALALRPMPPESKPGMKNRRLTGCPARDQDEGQRA
jgi:hypothetical protein